MKINGKDYRSLWPEGNVVHFIDQRKLPHTFDIFTARTVTDVVFAIKDMVVRGAPAIGAAAAYGMALGARDPGGSAEALRMTRPTAHDLFFAVDYMITRLQQGEKPFDAAASYVEDIINQCKSIGDHGKTLITDQCRILTHCNAGALATVDYGTALAPLRTAHREGTSMFVYTDETRPRLQGLLTAWELQNEGIPFALIVDNAAGYYLKNKAIDLVIVGADRIAHNGDFANKIGTYEKAVLAKENDVPFYVAAPTSTFDPTLRTGAQIIIEERDAQEVTELQGKRIMPPWVQVKNPAFDVTPKQYVTGYITEKRILKNPL
ncbi:MAG TPA: S-methyl-5-thioribose-1-phosphate isomerase [Candidatus Thermoplasmatota archaeon]|nr:S-methyl-5-thioribose-1-phosphate isomerase [Candidatus Thermoplasmatota archaeon]